MAFPGGATAAITLGWDDGTVADRRLVALHNEFGVPATFFLNSGKFGLTAAQSGFKDYVEASEVAELYRGHEVASHTVDHPDLTQLSDAEIRQQVSADVAALSELVGYPVTGFASPFRAQDARVEGILRDLGMAYSRGPGQDRQGTAPTDPLRWVPTGHCLEDLTDVLTAPPDGSVICIWGHSYEYDEIGDWSALARLLATVAASDCWVATHGAVVAELGRSSFGAQSAAGSDTLPPWTS